MQTPSRELETVARLLGALRAADGPVQRMQFVTEASRAVRELSDVDRRVLARWLVDHGAPMAAARVIDLPADGATSEARKQVARALLTLDPDEVDRFAVELRDPSRYRHLIATSLAPAQVPPPPPAASTRIVRPPPPQAAAAASTTQPTGATEPATPAHPAPPAAPAPEPGPTPRETRTTVLTDRPAVAEARVAPGWTPRLGRQQETRFDHLATGSARDRWRRIDALAADHDLTSDDAVRLLATVPDGWQRRTALRRLAVAGHLDVAEPAALVTSFARRSDRFAAAALLLRTGVDDLDLLVASVDPRDADRLRRRADR